MPLVPQWMNPEFIMISKLTLIMLRSLMCSFIATLDKLYRMLEIVPFKLMAGGWSFDLLRLINFLKILLSKTDCLEMETICHHVNVKKYNSHDKSQIWDISMEIHNEMLPDRTAWQCPHLYKWSGVFLWVRYGSDQGLTCSWQGNVNWAWSQTSWWENGVNGAFRLRVLRAFNIRCNSMPSVNWEYVTEGITTHNRQKHSGW